MTKRQALKIMEEAKGLGYVPSDLIVSPCGKHYGVLLYDQLTHRRIPIRNAQLWKQTDHHKERLEAFKARCKVLTAMHHAGFGSRSLPN